MKVSIIIPVYNAQSYIIRCLNSVSQQTFRNIECILVDDCGTDNSANEIENYIHQYTGNLCFMFIHHRYNRGQSAARNTGIEAATGDYLYFLDSDDYISPECIEILVQLALKYPQAVFVQGNIVGNDGKPSQYAFDKTIPEFSDNKEDLEHLILHRIVTSACNRLIKRTFIIDHNMLFQEGIIHEDMNWTYFLAKYTNAAAFTTKKTYVYFVHENSTMTSISKEMKTKRLHSRLWSNQQFLEDIKRNYSSKYQRQYIALNLLSCVVELNAINSLKQWIMFWHKIISISYSNLKQITFNRFIIFLCLMPPICFFVGKNKIRWRIQQKIICNV